MHNRPPSRLTPPTRHLARPLACAAVAALLCSGAWGQSSPWYVGAALGWSHDSNIYRLPDAAVSPGGIGGSDRITTASLLGGLDQTIGRQRLYGSASLRDNRFANNRALNNTGYGLKLGLDWATVGNVSGNLNVLANRELAFVTPDNGVPTLTHGNIARSSQVDGAVRLGLVSRWQLESTFGHRSLGYSATEYRSRETREDWATLGLRYRPSGALGLGLAWRQGQGRIPRYQTLASGDFLPDRFRSGNLDLTADWIASGASTINARLSSGKLTHSVASQRDYHGLTGELRWLWRPTGKLLVSTTLVRETGQEVGVGTSFFVTGTDLSRTVNGLRLRADQELSAKLSLGLGISRGRRALVNTESTILGVPFTLSGADTTNATTLGLRWTPTRSTQLSCDYSHERRSASSTLSSSYGVNVFGCSGQVTMQ